MTSFDGYMIPYTHPHSPTVLTPEPFGVYLYLLCRVLPVDLTCSACIRRKLNRNKGVAPFLVVPTNAYSVEATGLQQQWPGEQLPLVHFSTNHYSLCKSISQVRPQLCTLLGRLLPRRTPLLYCLPGIDHPASS